MNESTTSPSHVIDQIPEYVLGALDAAETDFIDRHLEACSACADEVEAAALVHRIQVRDAPEPPAGLRSTVLAAAFAERAPHVELEAGRDDDRDATAAWEAEIGRFRGLLDDPQLGARSEDELGDGAWNVSCIASFDLSVRAVACHLIAAESLRATNYDAALGLIPETELDLERRTRAVSRRHARLPFAATLDEFDSVVNEVGDLLRSLDAERRNDESPLVPGISVDDYTALRALETWTHADDVRKVLNQPDVVPEHTHLSTMTAVLPKWVSFVLSAQPPPVRDRHYRIELTGPGGRVLDVGGSGTSPDVELAVDAVEFCKLAGARRDPATFGYAVRRDAVGSRTLVHAVGSFELI